MIWSHMMMLKFSHLEVTVALLMCCLKALDGNIGNILDILNNSVTSKANDLLEGDDLELNCSLGESFHQYTAYNMSFKFQSKDFNEFRCLPASYIRVVEERLVMLTVRNVTVKDAGVYWCYVGNVSCQDGLGGLELVGTSDDINVEYVPKNVTNFSCLVENWESMTCTWQHPVSYVTWSNMEVTLDYVVNGDSSPLLAHKCPLMGDRNCTWSKGIHLDSNYIIEVNVTNKQHDITATNIFIVSPDKLVKPGPVKELNIQSSPEIPGCLQLSWKPPREHWGMIFRISQNVTSEEFTILSNNVTNTNYTACGYPAYTQYNFSVECYPAHPLSGFWSDAVYKDARTPMIAPDLGPRMTNGSFTSTECVNGRRNVTLMWQEVERASQNGIIDGYLIMEDGRVVGRSKKGMLSASVELSCNRSSELRVFAYNEGGNSSKPTVLLIPPVSVTVPKKVQESFAVADLSKQPTDGYEYSAQALWDNDGLGGSSSYSIFWCEKDIQEKCKGEVTWHQVPGNQTSYNISHLSLTALSYLFGISVTQEGQSSGIFWTSCLFIYNPFSSQQRLPQQTLTVRSLENEVLVSWTEIKCSYETQTRVTSYKVKWCHATENTSKDEISLADVPATQNMYTVSGLTADVLYKFTVQPVSDKDLGEEVTPWKEARPKKLEEKLWIIPVVCGIFVAFVFLILGCYIYRKCIKGRDKLRKMTSAQFLPYKFAVSADSDTASPSNNISSPTASVRLLSVTSTDSNMVSNSYSRVNTQEPSQEQSPGRLYNQQIRRDQGLILSEQASDESYKCLAHLPSNHQVNLQTHLSDHVTSKNTCPSSVASLPTGQDVCHLQDESGGQAEDYLYMTTLGEGKQASYEMSNTNQNNRVISVQVASSSVLGKVSEELGAHTQSPADVSGTVEAILASSASDVVNVSCTTPGSDGYIPHTHYSTEISSDQYSTSSHQTSTDPSSAEDYTLFKIEQPSTSDNTSQQSLQSTSSQFHLTFF